jgi:shikimate dehydrogenase
MSDIFKAKTNLVGLIGHPIKQTYSPFLHNLAFKLLNLDYLYIPFDVNSINLKNAVKGLIALNFVGFNVTIPYKTKIIPFLNHTSEEASIIGSVNTVIINERDLSGYNTDVQGVCETLSAYKNDIIEQECTIFGAGGSARSVIYALIKFFKPKKINLINRTEDRALVVRDIFKEKMRFDSIEVLKLIPPDIVDLVQNSKLVVNTTPLGMSPEMDDSVVNSEKFFNKNQIVFDLIYNPSETKFLRLAKQSGAEIINGLNMLIHQAAKSFELWTSEKFPTHEIKSSIEKVLSENITTTISAS